MTPAEKAAQTVRERRKREAENNLALKNDTERAFTICRMIRDNPKAANKDRLDAIRLLREMTN